jgi:hypothetical protein
VVETELEEEKDGQGDRAEYPRWHAAERELRLWGVTAHSLPDGAVAIDGTVHLVLRDATETMCGLPVTGHPPPDQPSLGFCDPCSKAMAGLLDRDVRRELSRRR